MPYINPNLYTTAAAPVTTPKGARHMTYQPICQHCRNPFYPARHATRYCSNRCRQAAYRLRVADANARDKAAHAEALPTLVKPRKARPMDAAIKADSQACKKLAADATTAKLAAGKKLLRSCLKTLPGSMLKHAAAARAVKPRHRRPLPPGRKAAARAALQALVAAAQRAPRNTSKP